MGWWTIFEGRGVRNQANSEAQVTSLGDRNENCHWEKYAGAELEKATAMKQVGKTRCEISHLGLIPDQPVTDTSNSQDMLVNSECARQPFCFRPKNPIPTPEQKADRA